MNISYLIFILTALLIAAFSQVSTAAISVSLSGGHQSECDVNSGRQADADSLSLIGVDSVRPELSANVSISTNALTRKKGVISSRTPTKTDLVLNGASLVFPGGKSIGVLEQHLIYQTMTSLGVRFNFQLPLDIKYEKPVPISLRVVFSENGQERTVWYSIHLLDMNTPLAVFGSRDECYISTKPIIISQAYENRAVTSHRKIEYRIDRDINENQFDTETQKGLLMLKIGDPRQRQVAADGKEPGNTLGELIGLQLEVYGQTETNESKFRVESLQHSFDLAPGKIGYIIKSNLIKRSLAKYTTFNACGLPQYSSSKVWASQVRDAYSFISLESILATRENFEAKLNKYPQLNSCEGK